MFLYIFFVFVSQICYCSACNCSTGVVLPTYAVALIGVVISILLFTTVALAVIVYKAKRVKGSDHTIFGKPRVSVSKYERQPSENSRVLLRNSMFDDDTAQLNQHENMCDNDDIERNDKEPNEANVETEQSTTEPPKKVRMQNKVAIFPLMAEKQINDICVAVLSRQRLKEATSLSDLDKIVNDAKEDAKEKMKMSEMSASSPVLDILDTVPSKEEIMKLPVFEPNSQESKLRDEMKAMFNKDEFKAKLNKRDKMKENEDVIKFEDEIKSKDDKEKDKPVGNQDKNTLSKAKQCEIITKLINDEVIAKLKQGKLKSRDNQTEIKSNDDSLKGDITDDENKEIIQDDIYDCPPPRLQNNLQDFPSSPHDDIYDFPPSPRRSDELYDFPPSPKPSDELYDIPPIPKPSDEIYECPPTGNRSIIVNDDDASGYQFPLTNSNEVLSDEIQYTNAKTVHNFD